MSDSAPDASATVPAGGSTPDGVRDLVGKLLRIPDSQRQFDTSAEDARRSYGLSGEVIGLLAGAGLPSREVRGDTLFSDIDLMNAALHLGFEPTSRAVRRLWAAALSRRSADGPTHYEIRYHTPGCPDPGHAATCRYRMTLPDGRTVAQTVPAGRPASLATGRVALRSRWPTLPSTVRDLLDALRGMEFMRLPPTLRRDVEFIRHTGLVDCAGSAMLLQIEGRRRGLSVRGSYGLVVVPPFSGTHHWAEVEVDGCWVPVDPVLIEAMIGWGMLDPAQWNPYRSPGAIFHRVVDSGVPLATHEGLLVKLRFLTRQIRPPVTK